MYGQIYLWLPYSLPFTISFNQWENNYASNYLQRYRKRNQFAFFLAPWLCTRKQFDFLTWFWTSAQDIFTPQCILGTHPSTLISLYSVSLFAVEKKPQAFIGAYCSFTKQIHFGNYPKCWDHLYEWGRKQEVILNKNPWHLGPDHWYTWFQTSK